MMYEIMSVILVLGFVGLFVYAVHLADKLMDCQAAYAILVMRGLDREIIIKER